MPDIVSMHTRSTKVAVISPWAERATNVRVAPATATVGAGATTRVWPKSVSSDISVALTSSRQLGSLPVARNAVPAATGVAPGVAAGFAAFASPAVEQAASGSVKTTQVAANVRVRNMTRTPVSEL